MVEDGVALCCEVEEEAACAVEGEAEELEEEAAAEFSESSAPPGARGNWAKGNLSFEV